jgi:hypothetical protein
LWNFFTPFSGCFVLAFVCFPFSGILGRMPLWMKAIGSVWIDLLISLVYLRSATKILKKAAYCKVFWNLAVPQAVCPLQNSSTWRSFTKTPSNFLCFFSDLRVLCPLRFLFLFLPLFRLHIWQVQMHQDDDDDEMLVVSVSCNAQVSLSQNPAWALQDSGKNTKFVTYVTSFVFFFIIWWFWNFAEGI